jgi:four helix bundle protein
LARYCSIAMGSASELEYHLLLARVLKLILAGDHERVQTQVSEVKRMLAGFLLKLTAES